MGLLRLLEPETPVSVTVAPIVMFLDESVSSTLLFKLHFYPFPFMFYVWGGGGCLSRHSRGGQRTTYTVGALFTHELWVLSSDHQKRCALTMALASVSQSVTYRGVWLVQQSSNSDAKGLKYVALQP